MFLLGEEIKHVDVFIVVFKSQDRFTSAFAR